METALGVTIGLQADLELACYTMSTYLTAVLTM